MDDIQVPIPPRLDGDQLSAYVIEAQRIADEAMLQEEQADACLGMPEQDGGDACLFQRVGLWRRWLAIHCRWNRFWCQPARRRRIFTPLS